MHISTLGIWAIVLLSSGAALAGESGSFTCVVPWYSTGEECDRLFAVRAGETVTLKVTAVKNGSNPTKECVTFKVVDANTKKQKIDLSVCPNELPPYTTWTNASSETCIVRLVGNAPKSGTRTIEGTYTVK